MDGECRRGSGGGLLPTASDLQYLPTLYLILLIHINIDIFFKASGRRFLSTLGLIHQHFACANILICGFSAQLYGYVGCVAFTSRDAANLPSE